MSDYLNFLINNKIRRPKSLNLPLIVLGSISIGGAGKTPAVIALSLALKKRGFNVGIISRGYKGRLREATEVSRTSNPLDVGDEPFMIAWLTGCPVFVGRDRYEAAGSLLARNKLDLILSDDGLQHYSIKGDINISLIDASMGLGNKHCLPVGPLRESPSRLCEMDCVLINLVNTNNRSDGKTANQLDKYKIGERSFFMKSSGISFIKLNDAIFSRAKVKEYTPAEWKNLNKGNQVHAVAAIAQPQNFFNLLKTHGIDCATTSFPNHHSFNPDNLSSLGGDCLIMTEKDAVKCAKFSCNNLWAVRVNYSLDDGFVRKVISLL